MTPASRLRICALLLVAMAPAARAQAGYGRSNESKPNAGKTPASSRTNEEMQPATLPPLPAGMTIDMIVEGDRLFHGTPAGCFACHGAEGEGLPAAGAPITTGLSYVPPDWKAISALITQGLPDAMTRTPIAMPPRGARGTLTEEQITNLAAYVWAISQTRGEPWPGGHASHAHLVPPGSTSGTASPSRPPTVKAP